MQDLLTQKKILLSKASSLFASLKKEKKKLVLCHGVFDLFHPGHLTHLLQAKTFGEILIVSITPDRFITKGPNRPFFSEEIRLQSLAALHLVDYVLVNEQKDALDVIETIKPDFYVKGEEYKDFTKDLTKKIEKEVNLVKKHEGQVVYTTGQTYSSSALLHAFFLSYTKKQKAFFAEVRKALTKEDLLQNIEELAKTPVKLLADRFLHAEIVLSSHKPQKLLFPQKTVNLGAEFLEKILASFTQVKIEDKGGAFFTHQDLLVYDFDQGLFDNKAFDFSYYSYFATENQQRQKKLTHLIGLKKEKIEFVCRKIYGRVEKDKKVVLYHKGEKIEFPAIKTLKLQTFFPLFSLSIQAGHSLLTAAFLAIGYSALDKLVTKEELKKSLVHMLYCCMN